MKVLLLQLQFLSSSLPRPFEDLQIMDLENYHEYVKTKSLFISPLGDPMHRRMHHPDGHWPRHVSNRDEIRICRNLGVKVFRVPIRRQRAC